MTPVGVAVRGRDIQLGLLGSFALTVDAEPVVLTMNSLKGDRIPLGARVFPVADSSDAMTSTRPFRKAMSTEAALSKLIKGSGTQFWPEAVQAFVNPPLDDIEAIRDSVQRSLR